MRALRMVMFMASSSVSAVRRMKAPTRCTMCARRRGTIPAPGAHRARRAGISYREAWKAFLPDAPQDRGGARRIRGRVEREIAPEVAAHRCGGKPAEADARIRERLEHLRADAGLVAALDAQRRDRRRFLPARGGRGLHHLAALDRIDHREALPGILRRAPSENELEIRARVGERADLLAQPAAAVGDGVGPHFGFRYLERHDGLLARW